MNGQRFYQQKRIEMKTEQCERSLNKNLHTAGCGSHAKPEFTSCIQETAVVEMVTKMAVNKTPQRQNAQAITETLFNSLSNQLRHYPEYQSQK